LQWPCRGSRGTRSYRGRLTRSEAALRQEQELRQTAEARLNAAERDGALRNVPRRLVKKVCAMVMSAAAV
jgi:hypothetical protein